MPEASISFSWATLARKYPLSGIRSVPTMDTATGCRTPVTASAERRFRPEVSKNSSTALSSNEGELARSITTCVPAMASLRPSPVMLLTPVLGEAATTSWPPWRRMATVFEPTSRLPPITTIFMVRLRLEVGDKTATGSVCSTRTLLLVNVGAAFCRLVHQRTRSLRVHGLAPTIQAALKSRVFRILIKRAKSRGPPVGDRTANEGRGPKLESDPRLRRPCAGPPAPRAGMGIRHPTRTQAVVLPR